MILIKLNMIDIIKSGEVRVIKTPVSERYCKIGDTAYLDVKNKQIRCGGVWFTFNDKWIVSQEIL